ncbi:Dot/Icm T4SS effector kinase LegK1 [Legionella maioricensis]|uniref:Protein kinase n=1 Tax=Legionella maioricensis TaxID=2896528 RepID=A0A9X2D0S3_9GAMM|nr:Dot/Icm T4SS effector kinase LegK1 [Legionella maioricensis]MCL9684313.1 protein kinase [Legionella maioricensis]MCL9687179.1 protein kinase [Legionella maioricensis]
MPKTVKLLIEPTKIHELSSKNSQIIAALRSFLDTNKTEGVWASHEDYKYTYNHINYQFSFTQSILKRKRKEGKTGVRFDIYDRDKDPLGKGGYGVVYPIIGTIGFKAEKTVLKSGNQRIVKIQDHSKKDQSAEIRQEYEGLLQAGHLHVKPPVFTDGPEGKKSYLVMARAKGIALEKILHPNKRVDIIDQIPELTVAKRFELTLAILNAIKTQVTDKNLVHRDLKPWNLMVDLNTSPPTVTVIDYGFNLKQGEQDLRRVGTRAYRPPESFADHLAYSTKSDVYSAGRILSYLWGDDYHNYYLGRDKDWSYIKNKSTNEHLFHEPDIKFFLAKEKQNQIRECINQMLSEDPNMRPTIEESITQFSQIDIQPPRNRNRLGFSHIDPEQFKIRLNEQIQAIQNQLIVLRNKERNLRQRGFLFAADAMKHLVDELNTNTELLVRKPEPYILLAYRNCCLEEINAAKGPLKNHRDSWWLVAEIATAIGLLGVGYLIALGINYINTNRVGLFSQTKSEQLIDKMKDFILDIDPPPLQSLQLS